MSRSPSESSPRVGFIGAGSVLWAYLQQLDRLIPRGLAREGPVCSRRRANWARLLDRRPSTCLVEDPSEVLEADVDIVVILTPPESHAELVRAALRSRKHVLVEKPMALDLAEASALVEEAASHEVYVMAAPFVQLAPTVQQLWTAAHDGLLGRLHSARALYGNMGSDWAPWYHIGGVGPLAEVGIYNLKTLTCVLGPVREVVAMESVALSPRTVGRTLIKDPDPDVAHLLMRHDSGALSSLVASHAIQAYRRPAVEVYGTEGTANLLGDDWSPRGLEVWSSKRRVWELIEPPDETWLWTDGLRELADAVSRGTKPVHEPAQDLHLIEVIEASGRSARTGAPAEVRSDFPRLNLTFKDQATWHIHDRTRSAAEQV